MIENSGVAHGQVAIDRGAVALVDIDETKAAALWFDGAVKVNSWVSIPEA